MVYSLIHPVSVHSQAKVTSSGYVQLRSDFTSMTGPELNSVSLACPSDIIMPESRTDVLKLAIGLPV